MDHLTFLLGTGFVVLIAPILSNLLADEFKAWTPSLVATLIATAVRSLPPARRQRCAEEWESHVNDVPGDIGKVTAACGKLIAAWKIAAEPFGPQKRVIDLAFAASSIVLLWPLFTFLLLTVKLCSSGPAFERRLSVGRHGRAFEIFKFRTMVSDADALLLEYFKLNPEALVEWEATGKLRFDPRLTAIGAILTSTTLDELPQLFNVLIGDMSMVGPRPLNETNQPATDDNYLICKPGLLDFRSDGTENSLASYASSWSPMFDLKIIFSAIWKVLRNTWS